MQIQRSLRKFMEPVFSIARATFAKNTDDDDLDFVAVNTLDRLGLVTLNEKTENGRRVRKWEKSDGLMRKSRRSVPAFDITTFTATAAPNGRLKKMASLRLLIKEIVPETEDDEEDGTEVTFEDMAVLVLATQRQAYIRDSRDQGPVWAAKPGLFEEHELRRADSWGILEAYHSAPIQMDEALIECFQRLQETQGPPLGYTDGQIHQVPMITTLLELELAGLAVPYMDQDRRLAWKSTDQLNQTLKKA